MAFEPLVEALMSAPTKLPTIELIDSPEIHEKAKVLRHVTAGDKPFRSRQQASIASSTVNLFADCR